MAEPSDQTSLPTPDYASLHMANVQAALRNVQHPKQIGPYYILEVIGEGGMGTVYKAAQREPIERTVALKVVKLGMDTREVIARFESERQALALMNHPNVAKVLDAGATDTGRPFFVMEYVAGEPITTFADHHSLTVKQRLELFVQACEAVQHAHQKAIIHRDLKPSNILVTMQSDKPVVKVIDFGVAKALNQKLTEKTLYTQNGQMIGTPEYMAPEQAQPGAIDIDTRTDVYSLGVILYELLTGVLPFETKHLRSEGSDGIQRIITLEEPARPSTKLSSLGIPGEEIARRRKSPLEALQKQLKNELDWIPLKAIRKLRSERYSTPTELALDIGNYLSQRPLIAGPESTLYRSTKFLRRNRTPVAVAATLALVMVGGTATTVWQAIRATRAEHKTQIALQETLRQKKEVEDANASAQAVNDFLTDDLLRAADPAQTRGKTVTVLEAVDAAAKTVGTKFKDKPILEAAIRNTLAMTYDALGEPAAGLPHAQKAFDERKRMLGPDHPDTLTAMNTLNVLLYSSGELDKSEPLAREVLARSRKTLGDNAQITLTAITNLANLLQTQNKLAEAEALYREDVATTNAKFGDRSEETIVAMHNLATVLQSQRRSAEAETIYRKMLVLHRELMGDDHPDTINTLNNLGSTLLDEDKLDEAETVLTQALQGNRKVLGVDHPRTALAMRNLAAVYEAQRRFSEAEPLLREALAITRRTLGEDHFETIGAMNNLSSVLKSESNYDEGISIDREVVTKCKKVLGETHPNTIFAMNNLGFTLVQIGKPADAEPYYAEVYRLTPNAEIDPLRAAVCMSRWGPVLVDLGKYKEAEVPLLEGYRRLKEADQFKGNVMWGVLRAMVKMYDELNRPEEAAKYRAEMVKIQPTTSATTRRTR